MAVRESGATGAAVLEIERFEFTGDGRIELVGTWTGLRARRFIRPTLVLRGEGEPKRLLAVLDHKPWSTDDGGEWVAAFDWKGEPVKFESAELNVGSGIDLHLPAPRMRPGKPRRFKQRVESHDATRELEAAKADAAPAAAGDASPAAPAASPVTPDASRASPDAPAAADAPAPDTARIESLRRELDLVRSARDRAREERDAAFEQVKAARAETEAERQAREQAVAQARAEER